jgi:diadenosine tetraphosphate (Ap4A) HIT family hydrolase
MTKNKAGIVKRFAKTKDYKNTLEKIIKTDKCPFCPENFKYHKKPILKKYNDWLVTENSWPYKDTGYHFIFIPKKHMENFSDLTDKDFQSVKYLVNWVINKYKIKGGGLTLRFGNQDYTGASVSHLHFHLIVPQLKPKTKLAKTVNFPIG